MGFDAAHGVVHGTDARRVRTWASRVFCDWLAAKLNDPQGPYAEALGVTPERQVLVTGNQAVANVFYKGVTAEEAGAENALPACPTVLLTKGPDDIVSSGQAIGDTFYKGARHNLTFMLDCAVKDAEPDDDNAVDEEDTDSTLADFVLDVVRRGYVELCGLGLNDLDIVPDTERQRAGSGRNPHSMTCLVVALDDYTPQG